MARRAEDVVAIPSPIDNLGSDFERECRCELAIYSASEEMFVIIQKTAGNDTNRKRPRGTMIGKEGAFL